MLEGVVIRNTSQNIHFTRILSSSVSALPNDKILHWSKLKAFADNSLQVMMIYVLDAVKKIVGKGENAGCQHCVLFPTMFSKAFLSKVVQSQDCVGKC